jgi:hypothetical protein
VPDACVRGCNGDSCGDVQACQMGDRALIPKPMVLPRCSLAPMALQ